MYFWNPYAFVRLVIFFITGILFHSHLPMPVLRVLGIGSLCVFFIFLLLKNISYFRIKYFYGILIFCLFFSLGGETALLADKKKQSNHYLKYLQKTSVFSGTVISFPTELSTYFRYNVKVAFVGNLKEQNATTGKIHLYVKKDSSEISKIRYGDRIFVKGRISEVTDPSNPKMFDYKRYLALKNIYGHAFVDFDDVSIRSHDLSFDFVSSAYRCREKASDILSKHLGEKDENGIAQALILGIKDHLSIDVKETYANMGVVHVLAVSGLHVGIIFFLFKFFFRSLKKSLLGSFLYISLSILTIWFYAFLTGLPPSVLRAATMFSIFVIGDSFTQKRNVYNVIGLTAFVLLLIDPYLIYDVGFQLSFIAVLGIVFFQPRLYGLLNIKNCVLDKLWMITCVSLAAQLATFPLSIYYFHQFPTLFMLSNLLVIPFAFVTFSLGLSLLLLDIIIPFLAAFFGKILSLMIHYVNSWLVMMEEVPYGLMEWLYIDTLELFMLYLIIIILSWSILKKSIPRLTLVVVPLLVLIIKSNLEIIQQREKHQMVVYSIKDNLLIDHIKGFQSQLYIEKYTAENQKKLSYQVDPFRRSSNLFPISESYVLIKESENFERKDSFLFGYIAGQRILIIERPTFHLQFKNIVETDLLIIEHESVKNIDWLLKKFKFKTLIFGSQNKHRYLQKMKRQLEKAAITNAHFLKEQGYFIMEI